MIYIHIRFLFLDALTCDEFEVAGASDASFNGEYEISPFNVTGASVDEAVYEKKNGGGKFIFWKNGGWALGSNKNTGVVNYRGSEHEEISSYEILLSRI